MLVEVSLFRTQFEPENIFVGRSKKDRQSFFDNWNPSAVLRIPRAGFNFNDPFRINANYFDVDRIYNYCEYKFFDTMQSTEPKEVRYYFFDQCGYVQDGQCRINATEDIWGARFYDIEFARLNPELYTYKLDDIGKAYETIDICNLYNFDPVNENNLLGDVEFSKINNHYRIGYIAVTATMNTLPQYIEWGVKYPVNTYLVPFFFDPRTKNVVTKYKDTQMVHFDSSGKSHFILMLDTFNRMFNISEFGFKILSSCIILDTRNQLKVTFYQESQLFPDFSSMRPNEFTITYDNSLITDFAVLQVQSMNGFKTDFFSYTAEDITIDDILQKTPYTTIQFYLNNNMSYIDTTIFPNKEDTFFLSYIPTLLPPYGGTITFTDNAQLTLKRHLSFEYGDNFIAYSETYTQWLQANHNSAITGLKVNQDARRSALNMNTEFGIANMGMDLLSSGASAAIQGMTGNVLGAAGTVSNAAANVGKFALDTAKNYAQLDIQQNKENQLLNLKIKDVQNMPDNVSFNGSVTQFIANRSYIRYQAVNNFRYDEIKKYHLAYGFKANKSITKIQSHKIFDYIKSKDCIINNTSLCFTTTDLNGAYAYLAKGVRFWYDADNYKNFSAQNTEVYI